jgi:hypothetical protein
MDQVNSILRDNVTESLRLTKESVSDFDSVSESKLKIARLTEIGSARVRQMTLTKSKIVVARVLAQLAMQDDAKLVEMLESLGWSSQQGQGLFPILARPIGCSVYDEVPAGT